jgi:ferredoxin
MKIVIDNKKCLRSGQCTYLHPKLLKEGPDGYPVVLVDVVPDDLVKEAEDAADICPSGAIDLTD